MSTTDGFGGVSNCYVFKSRLQEYAQKVGIPTPVYQTVKEGASHEPVFKSTVIVNNVRYDSLPGFFNRKAAEQSAAEIALMEIHKSGQMTECMPTVHETGLCKNLLQEYAQKMNYAIPSYVCNKQPSGKTPFSCTVEIGGIQYIGAAARTKREAEIKAARTALLAIQSSSYLNETNGVSQYTVLPGKKKERELEAQAETAKHIKPKKAEFKKKWSKKKFARNKGERSKLNQNGQGIVDVEDASAMQEKDAEMYEVNKDCQYGQLDQHEGSKLDPNESSGTHIESTGMITVEAKGDFQDARLVESNFSGSGEGSSNPEGLNKVKVENFVESQDGPSVETSTFTQDRLEISGISNLIPGIKVEESVPLATEANKAPQDVHSGPMGIDFCMGVSKEQVPTNNDPVTGQINGIGSVGDNFILNGVEERKWKEESEVKQEGGRMDLVSRDQA